MTRIIIRESFDCKVGPDKVFGLDKEEFAELLSGRELTRFVSDEILRVLAIESMVFIKEILFL